MSKFLDALSTSPASPTDQGDNINKPMVSMFLLCVIFKLIPIQSDLQCKFAKILPEFYNVAFVARDLLLPGLVTSVTWETTTYELDPEVAEIAGSSHITEKQQLGDGAFGSVFFGKVSRADIAAAKWTLPEEHFGHIEAIDLFKCDYSAGFVTTDALRDETEQYFYGAWISFVGRRLCQQQQWNLNVTTDELKCVQEQLVALSSDDDIGEVDDEVQVAIKVLANPNDDVLLREAAFQYFSHAAFPLMSLELLAFGRTESGALCLLSEHIEGVTLQEAYDNKQSQLVRLTLKQLALYCCAKRFLRLHHLDMHGDNVLIEK